MSVGIRGAKEVQANIMEATREISNATAKGIRNAALELERQAKINQTPHVDTDRLRSSIEAIEKTELFYEVGTNVEYAEKHEFQFPYLEPALETVRPKYPGIIKGEMKFR